MKKIFSSLGKNKALKHVDEMSFFFFFLMWILQESNTEFRIWRRQKKRVGVIISNWKENKGHDAMSIYIYSPDNLMLTMT